MSDDLGNEILQELKSIKSKLSEHDEEFKYMHSKFDEYDGEFKYMHSKFDEHDTELRSISRSVAKIEVEHSNKIDTLIDVTSGILEKLDSFGENFESNTKELDKHSDQIWNLESKAGII